MWLLRAFEVVFLTSSLNIFVSGEKQGLTLVISALVECAVSQGKPTKLDLVYFGKSTNLVEKVLRSLPETVSVTIKDGEENESWTKQLKMSTLLLFESTERFRKTAKNIKWLSNRWMRYRHIVYAPNLTKSDVDEEIQDGYQIDEVAFLMNETESSIDLVTSFMFTSQKCNQSQLLTINRFNYRALEWENSTFFPRKYRNFHGCSLKIVQTEHRHTFDIYDHLSIQNNFKPRIITDLIGNGVADAIYEVKYPSSYLVNHMCILMIIDKHCTISTPYVHASTVFFAPDGEPLTQLEKMFKMFSVEVWAMIIFTLGSLMAAIGIINRLPSKVQNFVFGAGIKTPFWNLLDIFLNGGQNRVPTRNFARFILILVITWSLIIRTCYQSLLFEFLQADIREPPVKSIYELKFIEDIYQKPIPYNENGRDFEFNQDYQYAALHEATEPSNKVIAIIRLQNAVEQLTYRSGESSLHKLPEVQHSWYLSLMFLKFNPFLEEFNSKIGRMVNTGCLYFDKYGFNPNKTLIRQAAEDIGPQVLTMDHLGVAFIAFSIPLTMSITVFLVEISIRAYRTMIPEICFIFALRSYLKM